ncbi:MAG: ABC transporter substrate-binding protein [Chloroflexota bacterium]
MNKMFKLVTLGIVVALLAALVMPLAAQDDIVEPSAPGEGGVIIESTFGSDPSSFNPIIGNDTVSSSVYGLMYPSIIALDPETFVQTPGAAGGLAEAWEYDESGTILTITIRQDMFWSDGEQITADDWIWAVDAVQSGLTTSPRSSALYQTGEGDDATIIGGPIHSVTKIDDFTVEVKLGTVERDEAGEIVLDENGDPALLPACDALTSVDDITVVPEHIYAAQFGEDYAAMDADPYFYPGATFGPFNDPFLDFGVQTSLLASQEYTDTTALDYIAAGEWVLEVVADQNVGYERFLAGDFTTLGIPSGNQNEFRELAEETGEFQLLEYPANGYTYLGFNLADPNNPQPGRDEDGNFIDQGIHPIFGDVLVRQSFAHGINVLEMIGTRPDGDTPATGILEGNGFPIAVHDHPVFSQTEEIYTEMGLAVREYDPELAVSLLEEAGWVDGDGDGVRECTGCLYATEVDPSFEGSPLTFTLLTNAGNVSREAVGETIKAQLEEIGWSVDFQAIEFGTLVDELLGQQFDALIIGWSLGLPFTPGDSLEGLFGVGNDVPGGGFNYTSYANQEFNAILDEMSALPGCDPATRNEAYAQAQQLLWEDAPYVWLFAGNVMRAAQANLANFDPIPNNYNWNIDDWVVTEIQN